MKTITLQNTREDQENVSKGFFFLFNQIGQSCVISKSIAELFDCVRVLYSIVKLYIFQNRKLLKVIEYL